MKKVLVGVLCVFGLVGIVAGWNQVVSAQQKVFSKAPLIKSPNVAPVVIQQRQIDPSWPCPGLVPNRKMNYVITPIFTLSDGRSAAVNFGWQGRDTLDIRQAGFKSTRSVLFLKETSQVTDIYFELALEAAQDGSFPERFYLMLQRMDGGETGSPVQITKVEGRLYRLSGDDLAALSPDEGDPMNEGHQYLQGEICAIKGANIWDEQFHIFISHDEHHLRGGIPNEYVGNQNELDFSMYGTRPDSTMIGVRFIR